MTRPHARRFVPHCAPLEVRETPAADSFDTSIYPFAPAGWQEWASNGSAYAGVSRDHATSGQQSLALYGTLGVQSRIWTSTLNPGDVSVQAYVLSDNPAPILLFARGSGLDSAAASYVGVTVGPVGGVSIVESVDGLEHVLASSPAAQPIATTWLNVRVQMTGDHVSVSVQGANTSEFLAPDGRWQADATDVLATAVSVQPPAGLAGIGRQSGSYGTGYVDDFGVFAVDATPVVVVPLPPPPAVVLPDPVEPPVVPVPPIISPPPVVIAEPPADVPTVPEVPPVVVPPVVVPPPVIEVPPVVIPPAVPPIVEVPPVVVPPPVVEVPPVVVPPPVPPDVPPVTVPPEVPPVVPPPVGVPPPPVAVPPTPVQHYSHIRLAQLAYDGTPTGDFEKNLAANAIDLLVPNPKYFDTFEAVAPDAQKFIYTNISNVYQELLTSWLTYADAHGVSREEIFYHVAKATPFSGNSSSSLAVNWFWSATRGTTDLTWQARGTRADGVGFGGADEAVTLTYPDRFRELNVTFKKTVQAGWAGTWEYVAAVDAAGNPTLWKTLPLVADGTAGLTADGQITFDPPADWVPSGTAGNRLYAVRFHTTAGTADQAPEAKSILGRDYVGAAGTIKGTIPAFDSQADADGDGYLSDAEYGNRRSGFDARFVSESRLFYPNYGQMRFITNPAAADLKAWAAGYYPQILAANPVADGFFLDNATGRSPVGSTAVLEPTANYSTLIGGVVQAVRDALGGRLLLANTTGGFKDATATTAAAGAAFEEFLLRPNDANWSQVGDAADIVKARLDAAGPDAVIVLDGRPGSAANMTDPRTQMGLLSYYYLLADPTRTYLMTWGGYAPAAEWAKKWIPAFTTDVGQPKGAMTVFAQGKDPQNDKLTYKVYAREYDDALVLFKPKSYANGQGTGTTDDATATTHQLNGNYRVLNADGTLGDVIQSITLRGGEGAVLMKA